MENTNYHNTNGVCEHFNYELVNETRETEDYEIKVTEYYQCLYCELIGFIVYYIPLDINWIENTIELSDP